MIQKRLLAATCLVIAAGSARAEQYRLTATGTVSTLASYYAGASVPTPPTTISIGDAFNATVSFDTSDAMLTPLFDADPTINIYYLPAATATVTIGNYTSVFSISSYFGNASIQLWNDYDVVDLTDSQSFTFYNYPAAGPYPFGSVGPRKQESLSIFLFDFTHTARTNDLISQMMPVSAFGSQSLSYSFNSYDASGNDQHANIVDMSNVTITLESAVPEPDSWALMIGGFALIGVTARSQRERSSAREEMAG